MNEQKKERKKVKKRETDERGDEDSKTQKDKGSGGERRRNYPLKPSHSARK